MRRCWSGKSFSFSLMCGLMWVDSGVGGGSVLPSGRVLCSVGLLLFSLIGDAPLFV
jgi:hypothetical protein